MSDTAIERSPNVLIFTLIVVVNVLMKKTTNLLSGAKTSGLIELFYRRRFVVLMLSVRGRGTTFEENFTEYV